jgi:hypothetical protein
LSKPKQLIPSLHLGDDLNSNTKRPSAKPSPEKQAFLNKRKQAAVAAGFELCACGGLIYVLTNLKKCGDCGSFYS